MANLSQLQMPSIDTGQLSGKDGKKIKSYLFQIQEMLRYALNDIDEDNLSEELRSKIESGGLSSEISQALDAITLRVTGLDDASVCGMLEPELTSVHIDCRRMGELSVARLQALLAGETDVPQVTVVPTELRVRGSS